MCRASSSTWIRLTIRISGWSRSSFITSRCQRSRISSAIRIEAYAADAGADRLHQPAEPVDPRVGPYAGTPQRSIALPNISECRHSSPISVSA